jgi:CRP-like cAMP-binding protein
MPSRKIKPVDISGLLSICPLLQDIGSEQIARIASKTRDRALVRGEALFHRGDAAHGLFLVIYGQIKLAFQGSNGNEQVVQLVDPRQCFGQISMLTECRHVLLAEAVADSLVLHIPKDVVLEMLDQHPGFARRMLVDLARRTQALLRDVEIYTQQSGAQRVIGYLQQHCSDEKHPEDSIEITLPAAKSIIASRLNLTPETLSRIFHELSSADLIAVQGKQIKINSLKRLHEYDA